MKRYIALLLLAGTGFLSAGCVQNRASRNGVFDENTYLRKAFLSNPLTDATDPPWIVQGTVMQVSSPNPLAAFGLYPSTFSSNLFKFRVTQDKLQMISQRNLTAKPDSSRTDSVLNAWPATNVDLKYRVNLDGETTNFYEENQERPWAERQYVKLNLGKNDLSDLAILDPNYLTDALRNCVDYNNASATLVTGSFTVDEPNNYLSWKVQVTLPLEATDPVCAASYRAAGLVDKATVTAVVMYSMTRLKPLDGASYKPLELAEKDPIRRKYGLFDFTSAQYAPRDPMPGSNGDDPDLLKDSGLLSARQLVQRFDLSKDVVYYLDPQMPDKYKAVFTAPNGIADQTNAIFAKVGVPGKLVFKDAGDGLPAGQVREFGDVRYSYIRWTTDPSTAPAGLLGFGPVVTDPRTGETLKGMVTIYDQRFALGANSVAFQYDALLKSIGASEGLSTIDDNGNVKDNPWKALPEPCKNGDTLQPDDPRIVAPGYLRSHHNQSTLFNKMQQYLNRPSTLWGNLGPSDFVSAPDPKYRDIYFDLLPYFVFRDPAANQFVTPEGGQGVFGPSTGELWAMRTKELEFEKVLARIDQGFTPYDDTDGPEGLAAATRFVNQFRELTQNHMRLEWTEQALFGRYKDIASPYPLMQAYAAGSRRCVNGKWETRTQWFQRYIDEVLVRTLWHEFGHNMGLSHNFMASVDERNWPRYSDDAGEHYGMTASSVMEYNSQYADETFPRPGWGPYDRAAIAWAYGNDAKHGDSSLKLGTLSVSGQASATAPWNDPYGFRADGTEITFLRCDDLDVSRTPMCSPRDWGINPSQITAHQIDNYDWQYVFRNQRSFYKYKSFANYGTSVATTVTNMRRFIPFAQEVQGVGDILRKLQIPAPPGVPLQTFLSAVGTQLVDSITDGSSQAAAFHKAVIQQAAGERPFSTAVDQRYGDVNVQGIIIDKVFAAQGWLGLAPVTNQNPNTTGRYSAPYTEFISSLYVTVAADTLDTVLGGGYDTYPWLIQSNIALFAQDSHSQNFNINFAEYREWIGLQGFGREADFLAYFQTKAKAANFSGRDPSTGNIVDCSAAAVAQGLPCTYDIRNFSDRLGTVNLPDGHVWVWMYLKGRNAWMAAERDRNPVTYRRIRDYNTTLAAGRDSIELYNLERPLKFYFDAYLQYR